MDEMLGNEGLRHPFPLPERWANNRYPKPESLESWRLTSETTPAGRSSQFDRDYTMEISMAFKKNHALETHSTWVFP